MDYPGFLRSVDRGALPPVVLVHGADVQLLDDALALVSRALFPDPSLSGFDRDVFEGRDVDGETVVNAALTLPVLSPVRLVVVRRGQALPARSAAALARYARDPNPAACLLLLADEPLTPTRERKHPHWLLEAVPPAAAIALPPRRGRAVEDWLRQRAQAEGLTVNEEAARLLHEWVGDDGATLLGEARKAALAGGPDNRAVGMAEVTAVVGEHRVSGIFELTRAIERREVGPALRTLERVMASEDPMVVLTALTRDLRTAWMAREWRSGGQTVEQIARLLRRPPGVVEAILASVGALSPGVLAAGLIRCWQVEKRLKSGGEPRAEIAALVADLARAR